MLYPSRKTIYTYIGRYNYKYKYIYMYVYVYIYTYTEDPFLIGHRCAEIEMSRIRNELIVGCPAVWVGARKNGDQNLPPKCQISPI